MFGVGFLCNNIDKDSTDLIGMNILHTLLCDTPKSPFYVVFLESGLANGFSPSGYEESILPTYYTIGFKNIKNGTEKMLEEKIFATLKRVVQEGFDKTMIEGVLHQIELRTKIAKSNFGIHLFQNLLGPFNHNVDHVLHQSTQHQE
jgi:Zn-dependent M16 (insulinase) family peptidase